MSGEDFNAKIHKNGPDALIVESGGSVDFLSGAALKMAGVQVTADANELNILDGVTATAAELNRNDTETVQDLVADGAITVKNGVCRIAKTVAGVVAATLANPTAGTDDYKKLLIISNQAQANTVTVTGGLGNGGSGEDVITFSGVVGDCVHLMAYGGYWYILGGHQYSVA